MCLLFVYLGFVVPSVYLFVLSYNTIDKENNKDKEGNSEGLQKCHIKLYLLKMASHRLPILRTIRYVSKKALSKVDL